ncbi:MAG TPA: PD-(D/E)XK nuclease family protein [Candidatus Dormibacteraeota bacterium]|jgi:hypothetical protein
MADPVLSPTVAAWPEADDGFIISAARVRAWHNSSLDMLQECGERFRRRYIEREVVAPVLRMFRGTVVHAVARYALARKMQTQGAELPTREEVKDLAATEFDRGVRLGGVLLTEEEKAEGPGVAAGRSKDFAVLLSALHVTNLAPTIRPVALERRIILKPKGTDLTINGTIDLVDAGQLDPEHEMSGEGVRDLKTTERSPAARAADTSQQLTIYSLLRFAEKRVIPKWSALDWLIKTPKRGDVSRRTQVTSRDRTDLASALRRIHVAAQAVDRGIFIPASPGHWRCDPRYCEFFQSCPYAQRGVRRPQPNEESTDG